MLSPAQEKVLTAIRTIGADGWPVTVREIQRATGHASPSTVHVHLANLERLRLIERNPRGAGVRDL